MFRIGQRVILKKQYSDSESGVDLGEIGTVIYFSDGEDTDLSFHAPPEFVAVNWDKYRGTRHSYEGESFMSKLNTNVEHGHGWWVHHSTLNIISQGIGDVYGLRGMIFNKKGAH